MSSCRCVGPENSVTPDAADRGPNGQSALNRHIALDGASNFRDLGGYSGLGGRAVRWRRIFRSDHLGNLTAGDIRLLEQLGVARVCDFRGIDERSGSACALPWAEVHSLAIEPTVVQGIRDRVDAGHRLTAADTVGLMQDTYRAFVRANTERFGSLFDLLLTDDQPLVFHCTAGKDRTGFAAALLLLALGVSRESVVQDYLLSNVHYRLPPSIRAAQAHLPAEAMEVLWTVQPDFLDSAFWVIDADYGGLETYLTRRLGLGPAARGRLIERYLVSR
ncbi:MAG: tyrosine-protein phosphatase [Rhodoferax sp.]|nr:tyrosine-protein phosphatase [Rhodoferax sp.]